MSNTTPQPAPKPEYIDTDTVPLDLSELLG